MELGRDEVLTFRLAGERARMSDLRSLVLRATPEQDDEDRRTTLTSRIRRRVAWTTEQQRAAEGWTEWATGAKDSDDLVDEVVALLLTQLLRSDVQDGGTFDAAEALIAELTREAGVDRLVLAHTQELESINHTRRSVSLRFPGSRIWDLPFLGHEFGHHLVEQLPHIEPGLADRRPLLKVTETTAGTIEAGNETATRARNHADELMADVLATICCGPTYPIACLVLRAPGGADANRSSESHPAWSDRVAAMRETLDALTDITGQPRHRQRRETVIDPLSVQVLGACPQVSAAGEIAARRTTQTVHDHREGLIYAEADLAIVVSGLLTQEHGSPPAGTPIRAVLDGAWRWRLANPSSDDTVAVARATAWCRPAPVPEGANP